MLPFASATGVDCTPVSNSLILTRIERQPKKTEKFPFPWEILINTTTRLPGFIYFRTYVVLHKNKGVSKQSTLSTVMSGKGATEALCSVLLTGLPVAREGEGVRTMGGQRRNAPAHLLLAQIFSHIPVEFLFFFFLGRSSKLRFPFETLYLIFPYYFYIVEVKC